MYIFGYAFNKFVAVFAVYFEYDRAVEIQRKNSQNGFCVDNVSAASQIHVKIKLRYDIDERLNAFGSIEQQCYRFHTNY